MGEAWGAAWNTTWFRFSGTIPTEWKGREVIARVKLGFQYGEGFTVEGLVWQDGVPTRAINVNRTDIPLAKQAKGGESFEFYVEAAANPRAAEHSGSTFWLPTRTAPPLFKLDQADIVFVNREAHDFYHDFKVAYETMNALKVVQPQDFTAGRRHFRRARESPAWRPILGAGS